MNDITIDNAGVALAASVYGRPELPPVLLMHGISNSRDVWYDWAVELSDRYRVYALDFRGHGHSARAEHYGIADYVSDATAMLAAIVASSASTLKATVSARPCACAPSTRACSSER